MGSSSSNLLVIKQSIGSRANAYHFNKLENTFIEMLDSELCLSGNRDESSVNITNALIAADLKLWLIITNRSAIHFLEQNSYGTLKVTDSIIMTESFIQDRSSSLK